MTSGGQQRLNRSFWYVTAIIVLLCAECGRAQSVMAIPACSIGTRHPAEASAYGLLFAPAAGFDVARKVAAQGDTTVIGPGKRDFLEPNAPNPFGVGSASTKISYAIAEDSHVIIKVYDSFYEEVVTLVDSAETAGYYTLIFLPPPTMPSGMYFYELVTDRSRDLRRMMYVK